MQSEQFHGVMANMKKEIGIFQKEKREK